MEPTHRLTDEYLEKIVHAVQTLGNCAAAARELGRSERTIRDQYRRAEKRGLTGRMNPAPQGFEVKHLRETVDKDGRVTGKSVHYGGESGDTWEAPQGSTVRRGTVQLGPDGRLERHWPRYGPEEVTPERVAEIVKSAFEDFTPFAPAIVRFKDHDSSKLTLYPLADWHVGMFAYGKETDGPDWDLSIARKVLVETFAELVDQTPLSHNAVILGLGDLLHADSHKNQTPGSGNIMDVDTRYSKCLPTVCDIVAECCEMVRQKHKAVEVAIKAGNHDVASTVGIRQGIRSWFRKDERVTVDESPSPYYWKRFGVNLIGGTHGDGCKAKDLPLFMANVRASDWAEAKSKHAHTGHLHNEFTFEHGGVKIHQHRAPIPQDAWHHAQGYRSGRSMRAFHYHLERGARGANEVEIL